MGPRDVELASDAGADGVVFRVTVPDGTADSPPVHVAGDFQDWNPASETHRLTRIEPRVWQLVLRLPPGPIQYKYARGDWSRVEKSPSGEEVANRMAVASPGAVFTDVVERWADASTGSTIVGDVRRLEALERTVLVYLPPGYDAEPSRRYPVLYMFDGQNVFDARTSFAGEWQADETAERLIAEGRVEPLVIVAVPNAGERRIEEYTPWSDPGFGQPSGGGQAHLRRVVEELVPLVDRTFRTRTGPDSTGICGSSLGGLMALYAAYEHAGVFGRVAAVSPSVWWADRRVVRVVAQGPRPPTRPLYTDMGTLEMGGIADLRALRDALVAAGFRLGDDLYVEEVPGAGHDERSWSARFPDILRRLFPAGPD